MKCPSCGEELKENQSIPGMWECESCGRKLKLMEEYGDGENQIQNQESAHIDSDSEPDVPIFSNEESREKPKQNNNKSFIIGVAIALVVIAVIVVIMVIVGRKNFKTRYSDIAGKSWCTIADDGSYMKIDTNPYDLNDYFEADAYYELERINKDLGFSSAVLEKMGETTALDGRQTEESKKATVSWKYHPDNGLEVTYEWN